MTNLIGIDPGKRGCGVGHFTGLKLARAAYVKGVAEGEDALAWVPLVRNVAEWIGDIRFDLAIELPQIYSGSAKKIRNADDNDLIQLAAVVGGLAAHLKYDSIRIFRPGQWKSTVPGDIMCDRIENKYLTAEERALLPKLAKAVRHNMIDGVGICLKVLKRF